MYRLKLCIKRTILYKPLVILKYFLKNGKLIMASFFFRFFRVRKNKIVFASMVEKNFSLQPKMVYEELARRFPEGLDIVWLMADDVDCPDDIRKVRRKSVSSIYELCTAKVWVDNSRKDLWVRKKKNQLYIQTWHGSVYIKGIENDCEKALPLSYVMSAKRDSKNADFFISEAKWGTKRLPTTFWYNGPIIEGEFKRDAYLHPNQSSKKVREYYGIKEDEGIVLYAPTFRKDGKTKCYSLDFRRVLEQLKEKNGKKYKCIVRLHPNIADKQDFFEYSNIILNGSAYPSVDELTIASDIIISDYSSCIFEGFKTKKKVFLYATDIDEYANDDRGLHFDLFNLPSPVARSNDELIEIIKDFDVQDYENKRLAFTNELGYYEADAAVLAADCIQNFLSK